MEDLYFTYIKIQPVAKNALVCKSWYMRLKFKLREKKIQYYDSKIYELIISKLYSNARIYMERYYDIVLYQFMETIINDNSIRDIIKKNMIEYQKTFNAFYNKYQSLQCSSIELNIADEYKKLLNYL